MSRKPILTSLLMAGALLTPGIVSATTITGWNLDNVVPGPEDTDPDDDVGGASVVYDTDVTGGVPAGADTNGQITYIAPESNAPGVKVVQETYDGVFDGCIMASSDATCTSPFQSGKRIKQQVTDSGTIDLVFDVEASGEASIYQVFHRLINVTGEMLGSFELSLGIGVGDDFSQSGPDDGLRFATNADGVEFGPDDLAAFSQFPFGLFGGEPLNPNPLKLPGFFDTVDRAGFDVTLDEDVIQSQGYYGSYDNLFGNWLSQEDVPDGLLYDYKDGADPLVMAWAGESGWEFLRETDPTDPDRLNIYGVQPMESLIFGYDFDYDPINGISEDMMAYIGSFLVDENGDPLGFGTDLFVDAIEDLANLNLTFAIALEDSFLSLFEEGETASFTMRVTTYDVAPVPLPAAAPFLIAGLGAFGLVARRRRKAA